jgi:thiosulfate reductase cytochrome b subunit
MTQDRLPIALGILRWTLGLVIMAESLRFALSAGAVQAFAKTGLPNIIRPGLAWAEIAAAILFLIPRAAIIGGWSLIAVLGLAIVIHFLHGWFDVGALLVYAAAAWAVMAAAPAPTANRA